MTPPPPSRISRASPGLRAVGDILLTLLCTAAMILSGPFAVLVAVGSVLLWRRLTGRPWRGTGLGWDRWALPSLVAGVLGGALALLGANAVAVAVGAARWTAWEPDNPAYLPLVIAMIVVGTALPEELLWRGNLQDLLTERLSATWAVVLTSVLFGALHLFSQSPAQGTFERVLFAVGAVALGLVCAASRLRTGAIWAAVGVHAGFYFGTGFFPTEAAHYGVRLAVRIIVTTAPGPTVLGLPDHRDRTRRTPPRT
ncbi:CPBP family intramembrane glutamic endopeptidase [Nocardiopsis sp. CC223A]|uniref:CPBP family intramembrane glutamic endopeptidase n=1 Tax=Nocardiopsis sp. CC223A TaxID=3044051 RepID=UPI00278BD4A5|nr:CPBP family intramembrane glutamic endopeptidase [Nocardiopsis sp. CC223A]